MRLRSHLDCELPADSVSDQRYQAGERRIRGGQIFRLDGRHESLENIDLVREPIQLELAACVLELVQEIAAGEGRRIALDGEPNRQEGLQRLKTKLEASLRDVLAAI